ncbi:DUF364 domain-containing protein [Dehalobacter restrictus]|uniref:Rossmann-like domain-containing protein n=1 Tax=Dehalobacter restrictus TaxID=55583 RepID=UPI00338E8CB1
MYGPSAQIVPDFLFNCGLNYITSSRIGDYSNFEYQLMHSMDIGNYFKTNRDVYSVSYRNANIKSLRLLNNSK